MRGFKNEDLSFDIFEEGRIMRTFSGLVPSKLKIFSKIFNGSICAYRLFYSPILRGIAGEGGIQPPPHPGPYNTVKSVVLRGLTKTNKNLEFYQKYKRRIKTVWIYLKNH